MEIVREFLSTVFVVNKGKVLMTWNKKVNNWIPIGGHIEPNELPCSSVVREAKEESGLDIELVSPFDKSKTANLVQPVHIHLDHMNLRGLTPVVSSFSRFALNLIWFKVSQAILARIHKFTLAVLRSKNKRRP